MHILGELNRAERRPTKVNLVLRSSFSVISPLSQGAVMMDAPVSGGVPAAASGSLTFIVGGSEDGVERARPLLEAMGKNVLHCGEAGTGCVAKVRHDQANGTAIIVSHGRVVGVQYRLACDSVSLVFASQDDHR